MLCVRLEVSGRVLHRYPSVSHKLAGCIAAKYHLWCCGQGARGLDFGETRGWKADGERDRARARADCSHCEENNANNGGAEALWWDPAYAVNTITLWTRLPFKWKQTWNAKIHRRLSASASQPEPCLSAQRARKCATASRVLDHRYANSVHGYTRVCTAFRRENISCEGIGSAKDHFCC